MSTIIYDARRLKAYGRLQELAACVGRDEVFVRELWKALVEDDELMKEFAWFLDHHSLLDEMKCCGYGLTDLYVWLIERFNLMMDYGKNGQECNKDALVLDAFMMMSELKKNPEEYVRRLSRGEHMDRM